MMILRLIFAIVFLVIISHPAFAQEREIAKTIYRVPLSEAGQSGVCVQGDRLFLTVWTPSNPGPMMTRAREGEKGIPFQ